MFVESTATGDLLMRYGYLAIFFGALLEGETVALVAGFFAHQGYLSLPLSILCAIAGSLVSDQTLFFIARIHGLHFLERFPRVHQRVQKYTDRARTRPIAMSGFALLFRFFYGLRNIAPLLLGASTIPTLHFVVLNTLGAILWGSLFSCIGYLIASLLTSLIAAFSHYEVIFAILLALICSGALFWHRRNKSHMRK